MIPWSEDLNAGPEIAGSNRANSPLLHLEKREFVSDWNSGIIEEFRANEGKVGGMFEGAPLLLLHHKGAKTGTERVSPLMYQSVDGGYAVFASKAGADENPDWFYNVNAHPETKVEIGSDTVAVRARVAGGDAHDQIWNKQKEAFPQFEEYEEKTSRDRIPVVILEPVFDRHEILDP